MAKNRNPGGENPPLPLPSTPVVPGTSVNQLKSEMKDNERSEFDKFLNTALDSVVVETPAEVGVTAMSPEAMASTPIQTPPVRVPTPQPVAASRPLTQEEMARSAFIREEEARIALREVKTPSSVPLLNPENVMVKRAISLEDTHMAAFRASLRAEEDRIAARPVPPPLPAQPHLDSVFGTAHTLHTAREPVIREGANPLAVEAYQMLRRLVAGQYVVSGGLVFHELKHLIEKMQKELEVSDAKSEGST